MARYRKVEVATWSDDRFLSLSAAPPNAQTLWLYLLCGPRTTTFPGLVVAREEVIASDLGWDLKGFREAFAECFEKGLVKADWKVGLVCLRKALFDSQGDPRGTAKPANPNVLQGWSGSWETIPECELKFEYLDQLGMFAHSISKAFGEAFRQGFGKALAKALAKASPQPLAKQETGSRRQEQEQEKEKKSVAAVAARPLDPESVRLAGFLADRIAHANPATKIAKLSPVARERTVAAWSRDLELLHRIDKISSADIEATIAWCTADSFWSSNILSGKKLREKYDTLQTQRSRKGTGAVVGTAPVGRAGAHPPEAYEADERDGFR